MAVLEWGKGTMQKDALKGRIYEEIGSVGDLDTSVVLKRLQWRLTPGTALYTEQLQVLNQDLAFYQAIFISDAH